MVETAPSRPQRTFQRMARLTPVRLGPVAPYQANSDLWDGSDVTTANTQFALVALWRPRRPTCLLVSFSPPASDCDQLLSADEVGGHPTTSGYPVGSSPGFGELKQP